MTLDSTVSIPYELVVDVIPIDWMLKYNVVLYYKRTGHGDVSDDGSFGRLSEVPRTFRRESRSLRV
jgi:hypothetical protein